MCSYLNICFKKHFESSEQHEESLLKSVTVSEKAYIAKCELQNQVQL